MRNCIIIPLLGCSMWWYSFISTAQTQPVCRYHLQGLVQRTDGLPIPEASIWIEEIHRNIQTDSTGHFTCTDLCQGIYTLRCQFMGYQPVIRKVIIPFSSLLSIQMVSQATDLKAVTIIQHRYEGQQLLQVQAELSGQGMDESRGQSLGESLKALTGMYSIQTGPSISKPVIHGLHSNRILILTNGVRQEGQQWGSEHAPEIDAFLASQITVIKGAASIRYGSDAIGGVILLEPKNMPTQPGIGGEAYVAGASNGRMGVVSGMLEGVPSRWIQGLSWRIQGTLKKSGYIQTPRYYLENTSYQERNFSGDVHYDRKNAGLEVFYSRFATKIGLFTEAQIGSLSDLYAAIHRSEPLVQPRFSYELNRPYQDIQHDLVKLRTYVRSERLGTFTATLARQQNLRQEYDYVSFSGSLNPELYLKLITHTADLIWEKSKNATSGQWSSTAGFTGFTQGNVRKYLFLIPNFRTYTGGVFALERFSRKQWSAEMGLRYDYRWLRAYFLDEPTNTIYYKTHNWSNTNASLGISYQLRPNLDLTTNVSTAWRAPNVAELYSNGLHQSAVAYEHGNANLRPEQAYNASIALHYSHQSFTAELGLYSNLISNYIYLNPDSLPLVRQRGVFPSYSYNQVRATFKGVDLTFSYAFTTHLSFTSKTSLLYAYDHTNQDYLVFITPNRTDNSITYTLKDWKKMTRTYLKISGLYVARQTRAPTVTSRLENGHFVYTGDFASPPPGYFLFGAEMATTLALAKQSIGIILSGTNLTNVVYRDYLNRFRYFAAEPGRSINLKIKIPF
ncbi:TonB-dependent receptor [Siphonobacter sp. SORGH_AS_0500]|nr:TonB-dependent receptor [Siphonobacter sp. SORGH_AS_0500]